MWEGVSVVIVCDNGPCDMCVVICGDGVCGDLFVVVLSHSNI